MANILLYIQIEYNGSLLKSPIKSLRQPVNPHTPPASALLRPVIGLEKCRRPSLYILTSPITTPTSISIGHLQ